MVRNTCPKDVKLIPSRPVDALTPGRRSAMVQHQCVFKTSPAPEQCKGDGEAKEFSDDKSLREYMISGMCQACQDDFWNGPGDY